MNLQKHILYAIVHNMASNQYIILDRMKQKQLYEKSES